MLFKEDSSLMLFSDMLRGNVRPDSHTFSSVVSSCAKLASLCHGQDMVKEGHKYFNSISEHGMTPTLDHYACMITLLGRSGDIDKAVDLIKAMPHKPNYQIWSALLSVCSKEDIKTAEFAANYLFQLDPRNAGPYIMLSNLYAACGK